MTIVGEASLDLVLSRAKDLVQEVNMAEPFSNSDSNSIPHLKGMTSSNVLPILE